MPNKFIINSNLPDFDLYENGVQIFVEATKTKLRKIIIITSKHDEMSST